MLTYAFYPVTEANGNEELKNIGSKFIAFPFMGRINEVQVALAKLNIKF
jgi:hypothetical protein